MNLKEGKLRAHSLFLGSRGSSGNEGKTGVGVGGVVEAGVGHDGSSGDDGGGNRGSDQRSGLRHNVDGSRGLLGGKTTGSGVIESSLESGLGSGNILNIVQVGSSDLSSLHVVVDR